MFLFSHRMDFAGTAHLFITVCRVNQLRIFDHVVISEFQRRLADMGLDDLRKPRLAQIQFAGIELTIQFNISGLSNLTSCQLKFDGPGRLRLIEDGKPEY